MPCQRRTRRLHRGALPPVRAHARHHLAEALAHLCGPIATVLLRAPTDLPVLGPVLARAVPFARDFGRSDHVPFWSAGLSAVQITDTANVRNPHYHRPSDLPQTLNIGRLAAITAATAHAVERLAGTSLTPTRARTRSSRTCPASARGGAAAAAGSR
jgi:hypothetical protein